VVAAVAVEGDRVASTRIQKESSLRSLSTIRGRDPEPVDTNAPGTNAAT
jgi:hypothetical protein